MSDSLLKAAMTADCGPPNVIAMSCVFGGVSEVWATACPVVSDRHTGHAGPRWNLNTLMYVIQPTRCHLYGFYFHCHLGGHAVCVKGSVGSLETPWWQVWWCVKQQEIGTNVFFCVCYTFKFVYNARAVICTRVSVRHQTSGQSYIIHASQMH